jgi:hypothetical protein
LYLIKFDNLPSRFSQILEPIAEIGSEGDSSSHRCSQDR